MSAGHLHSGVAGDPHSPIHRLDPRAKLIGLAGVTFVAVSTPLSAWPAYVACALALVDGGRARPRPARGRSGAGRRSCSRSSSSSRSSCRSCARASRSISGRSRLARRAGDVRHRRREGDPRHAQRGPAGRDDELPGRAARARALEGAAAARADRGLHVPLPVHDRRRGPAHARRAGRPRLRAAARPAGRRDRPRRHRAVPAHLRARRARAPGDARARLAPDDAAPGRARLPPRRRAVPVRPCPAPARVREPLA